MAISPALTTAYVAVAIALMATVLAVIDIGLIFKYKDDIPHRILQQEGTFIWTATDSNAYRPGSACPYGRINNVIVSAIGTGYMVGDLIVGQNPGVFMQSFVYQVTEVDENGGVVAYDILTSGCLQQNNNVTVTTMSVGGSGFEVVVDSTGAGSDPSADDGVLYLYPLPSTNLLAPLQVSRYRLYTMAMDGVEQYILEMDPPGVPIQLQSSSPKTGVVFFAYGFNNSIPAVNTLGDWEYNMPLTPRNWAAFNMTDDAGCAAAGTLCFESAYWPGYTAEQRALNFAQSNIVVGPNVFNTGSIQFSYGSVDGSFDFIANHATFTLNRPIKFFLHPSA